MSSKQQPPPEMKVADLGKMFAPYNPREMPDAEMEALRASLREFGPVEPIVVNRRTDTIVGGHQRIAAAALERIDALPVVYVDLDELEEKRLNLALNKISGRWDDAKLREVLLELESADADWLATGFAEEELDRILQTITDGDTAPDDVPDDVPRRCESGDLWVLGPHRLLCGDATVAKDVARLTESASPLLCVTDPPYGVEYDPAWRQRAAEAGHLNYGGRRVGEVINDDRCDWREAWELVPGDVIYAWSASGGLSIEAGKSLIDSGFEIRNQIIWKKPHFPISRGHYTYTHEPCWYAVRQKKKAHWIGDNTQSSVWEVSLDKNVPGGHSTQKPVELFRRAIANHRGDVYEPFCGSGTCLIAAEQLSRRCFAIEIHPEYCDISIARWEAFTGEKAKKA